MQKTYAGYILYDQYECGHGERAAAHVTTAKRLYSVVVQRTSVRMGLAEIWSVMCQQHFSPPVACRLDGKGEIPLLRGSGLLSAGVGGCAVERGRLIVCFGASPLG